MSSVGTAAAFSPAPKDSGTELVQQANIMMVNIIVNKPFTSVITP